MFEKIFIILKIKKLRKEKIDNVFLSGFRDELKDFIAVNPVAGKADSSFSVADKIFSQLAFKPVFAVIAAFLAIVFSGAGIAAASQSSLPSDKLYPVKILTEDIKAAFTFTEEAKARLHVQYAAKRVEEVQKILKGNDVDAKGLEMALENLKENMSKSASIIDKERGQGKNVNKLAREVQSEIEITKMELEGEMNLAGKKLKNNEEHELLKKKAEKVYKEIEDNEDRIGKSEEFKKEAEEAIINARKQLEMIDQKVFSASADSLMKYGEFMDKADRAITNEHWVQARQQAKHAVRVLEDIEKKEEKNDKKNIDDSIKPVNRKSGG